MKFLHTKFILHFTTTNQQPNTMASHQSNNTHDKKIADDFAKFEAELKKNTKISQGDDEGWLGEPGWDKLEVLCENESLDLARHNFDTQEFSEKKLSKQDREKFRANLPGFIRNLQSIISKLQSLKCSDENSACVLKTVEILKDLDPRLFKALGQFGLVNFDYCSTFDHTEKAWKVLYKGLGCSSKVYQEEREIAMVALRFVYSLFESRKYRVSLQTGHATSKYVKENVVSAVSDMVTDHTIFKHLVETDLALLLLPDEDDENVKAVNQLITDTFNARFKDMSEYSKAKR